MLQQEILKMRFLGNKVLSEILSEKLLFRKNFHFEREIYFRVDETNNTKKTIAENKIFRKTDLNHFDLDFVRKEINSVPVKKMHEEA